MTEMDTKLKALYVDTVYVVGLAWDFCVSFTQPLILKNWVMNHIFIADSTREVYLSIYKT